MRDNRAFLPLESYQNAPVLVSILRHFLTKPPQIWATFGSNVNRTGLCAGSTSVPVSEVLRL